MRRTVEKILLPLLMLSLLIVLSACGGETSPSPGPITYDRIVIESYHPEGALEPSWDTFLELYTEDGSLLADDDNGDLFAKIDYTLGLISGFYYIRVNSDTGQTGPYAVRAVVDDAEAYAPDFSVSSDDYEGDDPSSDVFPLDNSPVGITLGSANRVGRSLDAADDVDWLKLSLP
jgi:hypothetical protein